MDAFENSRLELFRGQGFEANTSWLTDGAGRRTAAVVGGTGNRTTLLLHGALSNAGEWALVAPGLAGRLVIPDWPGSGLTAPVGIRERGVRRFAVEWLESVVEALGVDEVDIVGSSAGGYMGLVFALAHPHRVRRLVQVGSYPGLRRAAPLIFRLFATPVIGRFLLSQQPKDAEDNRRQVFSNLVAHPERIPVEMLEADLAAMALPNSVPSALDFCRSLLNPITGMRPDVMVASELPNLDVPTLALWGASDNFIRPEAVRSVVEAAPRASLEIVDDAGHLLTLEAADRVVSSTRAFLDA